VQYFGAGNEQYGYKLTMGLLACMATVLFLITFATTRERVEPPADQSSSPLKDTADLCCNKPCILLFFIGLLGLASFSVHLAAVSFYFKYYTHGAHQILGWQLESHELISVFFTLATIFGLIGVLATKHIVTLFGKVAAYIILRSLASAFVLPQYYVGPENVSTLLLLQGCSALFGGPVAPIVFSMYADAADYSEHKTGRRATGLVMSFASFGMKFGWAIGGALGGWLLAWSGYIPDQEQTPEAIGEFCLCLAGYPPSWGWVHVHSCFFTR
jgi:GPH family glycoside/pentoside/hexuronide:cation symporter